MAYLTGGFGYIIPALIVLTVLVFVHELGHYLVARWNGVRIETFSIGFGPELFGWTDRTGTRWKVSAVPLGGYVKMFGDADPSSMPGADLPDMTEEEKKVSFHHKRLPQRAAVVAAGPVANFIFAIAVWAALFATVGQQFTAPDIGQVQPGSAAEAAGLQAGDVIEAIDGHSVASFEDVSQIVFLNSGASMTLKIRRGGQDVTVNATPRVTELTDRFGNKYHVARLGIIGHGVTYIRRNPISALSWAADEAVNVTGTILKSVEQMVTGRRGADEVGGPLSILKVSGEVAQGGVLPLLGLMALLSVNLGLINLFPIPVLDGGHLLFYAAEAIRGRPLGQRAQEYGFRLGLALVLTLMVFATWNDLVHLGVFEKIKGWMT
jgi:regulator of sigma E protease